MTIANVEWTAVDPIAPTSAPTLLGWPAPSGRSSRVDALVRQRPSALGRPEPLNSYLSAVLREAWGVPTTGCPVPPQRVKA